MPKTAALTGVASALLALGLFSSPAGAQEPAPTASPKPQVNRPVTSPGNADWAKDPADAQARAAAAKKLVYYEFANADCGDCRRMQALLYPAFDFEALLVGMVPVQVVLDSPEGKKLGERYSITEVPAVLITTPEGRLVFQMQGFKDAPDFYHHVRKDLDEYRQFSKTVDAQNVATLPAKEAYSTGRALYARMDYAAAAARLRRAAAAPDATPALRESALMGLAAAERQLGEAAQARKTATKVIASTKDPDQKERAELFLAELDLEEGKPGDALAAYRKFATDHPKSPYLEKVRGFISRLEAAAPK